MVSPSQKEISKKSGLNMKFSIAYQELRITNSSIKNIDAKYVIVKITFVDRLIPKKSLPLL